MLMNPRVVVVDDDDDRVRQAVTALTVAGYQCEACGSAKAALAALEERGADVLVADWDLPQMSGVELLRTVRLGRPSLPVIVFTGSATVSLAVTAMREGASDCIAKPYAGAELCAAVGRVDRPIRCARITIRASGRPAATVRLSPRAPRAVRCSRSFAESRPAVRRF